MNAPTVTPSLSNWRDKARMLRVFLRRAWTLALPYFNHREHKWRARAMLVAIVALNLGSVYMLVQINAWNRVFYDALQARDAEVFWQQLGRFLMLALGYVMIAVYQFYLTQLLSVRWRTWLTENYVQRWLRGQAYYRMELLRYQQANGQPTDNPDQRIHEDLDQFTSYTMGLVMGLLNAVVTLVSFVGILWALSGSFSFYLGSQPVTIPGFMVWMALLYCAAGSWLTHVIGRPLSSLMFKQQRVEADFRHQLIRLREYSDAVVLDHGEGVEKSRLQRRFGAVLTNYIQLLLARKRLTWFTVGFNQMAVVFPFVVAAPRFFSGAIQLGQLMQIASAFGRVQDGLSWFVDNYSGLAQWYATTERLTLFETALERAAALDNPPQRADAESDEPSVVRTEQLNVALPNGQALLQGVSLRLLPGQSWWLQGPSGTGKSTLLRTLAGVWPWHQGQLWHADGFEANAMFLPQRAYFPNAPLREALCYPQASDQFEDAALQDVLHEVGLGPLAQRLAEEANWSQTLSGGEQQRLALARALLKRPRWLFLDEATSALDEATEQRLYAVLLQRMQADQGLVVSVAHRAGVGALHQHTLDVAPFALPAAQAVPAAS
jgi:putative ATP-binding cassette transporter